MEKSKLYIDVRRLLEKGRTINNTIITLQNKGHTKEQILEQVNEFYKDEKTNYDDKLVREIEKRFNKGETIQQIMNDLIANNHKPFEVEKAILRADFGEGENIKSTMKKWELSTYINIIIFLLTILLGLFYNKWFFLGTGFMLLVMAVSSIHMPKKYKEWDTEIDVMPIGGFYITQGLWGYNPIIGNYFRWWILEPGTLYIFFFLIFGIILFAFYGINFLLYSLLLAALSIILYLAKPTKND